MRADDSCQREPGADLQSSGNPGSSSWLSGISSWSESGAVALSRNKAKPVLAAFTGMPKRQLPAVCEPANSQFFLPTAMGRIAFSTGLLSIGWRPSSR